MRDFAAASGVGIVGTYCLRAAQAGCMQLPLNDPNAARAEAGRPGVVPTAGARTRRNTTLTYPFKMVFFCALVAMLSFGHTE